MNGRNSATLAGTVTRLIDQIAAGEQAAEAELCELVYRELRIIGRRARQRGPAVSLESTEIVHEVLGKFVADGRLGQMKSRRYLYAAAADQMRRMIIDHWRKKRTKVQGGHLKREPLDPWLEELTNSAASRCRDDLEGLERALQQLKQCRPRQHEIVQLKFFAGLTNEQIAEVLEVSIDTVKRDWKIARARLGAYLISSE